MRTLGDPETEAYLAELVRNRGDEAPTVQFFLGDRVYASILGENTRSGALDRFEEGEWGAQDQDTASLDMDVTMAGRVPFSYRYAPITINVLFGGVQIMDFFGVESIPAYDQSQTGATKLEANSPGAWLDRVSLRKFTEFDGVKPEIALLDALYRIGYYDRSDFDVFNFGRPLFSRVGEDGFHEQDTPASIIGAVLESVGGVAIDKPTGGIKVMQNPYTGVNSLSAWHYDAEEILDWAFPTPSGPDELYSEVVVASEDTGQDASNRVYESAKVDWSGVRYPPLADQVLYIPFSDTSANADTHALDLAMRTARQLSAGTYQAEFLVPYNPFLEKWDAVTISEMFWDDAGTWHREWLAVITGYCRTRGAKDTGLTTAFSCRLTLTSSERVPGIDEVPEGVAQGIRSHGIPRPIARCGSGVRVDTGVLVDTVPS